MQTGVGIADNITSMVYMVSIRNIIVYLHVSSKVDDVL